MSGKDDAWAVAVAAWAQSRPDIRALVQIGSRVQENAPFDAWSDYDYQLITSRPGKYRDGTFTHEIGPCWVSGAQVAFGNSVKVTAVYEGALEADFVVLRHMEVVIATAAMRWPSTSGLWPRVLRKGVQDFRIVVSPGWKVIKGGALWEERYSRTTPYLASLSECEFNLLCGEFWTQLVWAAKKAARGEFRASQRALHVHLLENTMRMLQEQALIEGRKARPLSRQAEAWLSAEQLRGTEIRSFPDRAALMAALEVVAAAFAASSGAVAASNGWSHRQPSEVSAWLMDLRLSQTGKAQQ